MPGAAVCALAWVLWLGPTKVPIPWLVAKVLTMRIRPGQRYRRNIARARQSGIAIPTRGRKATQLLWPSKHWCASISEDREWLPGERVHLANARCN
jgi:hypothetical protein